MLLLTHFWINTLAVSQLDLTGSDLILAYIFGSLIDADHILPFIKEYMKVDVMLSDLINSDKSYHTFIHEPIGAVPVILFSFLIGSYIPILFWCIHILTDHIILKSKKRPFYPVWKNFYEYGLVKQGTRTEWFVSSVLSIIAIVWLHG